MPNLREISIKKFSSGKNWLLSKLFSQKGFMKVEENSETKQAPMAVQQIEKWRLKNRTLKNVIIW